MKLESCISVISGSAFKPKFFNDQGEGLPLIRVRDVNSGFTGKYYSGAYHDKYLINNGDLLIGMDGDFRCVEWKDGKAVLNQRVCKLIPNDKISKGYLLHFLPSALDEIHRKTTYTTVKHLSVKQIKNIDIDLPSLDTQKRIAQVLTDCETLITQRKESIALLDELVKSTFLEMFGDPRTNEMGWEFDRVIEFADCIVPGRDKPKNFTGDIPWVTTNDLKHLGFTNSSIEGIGLTEEEISQVKARTVPEGSVLMTCVGDLGVISIAQRRMLVNQQLHSFQVHKTMNNIFLMYALSFQKLIMYKLASKTTVPYLNKTNCNSIPVINPNIELQNEFAQIVEKVEATKALYKSHLTELENLYARISQDAFKGKLDVSKVVLREEFIEDSIKKSYIKPKPYGGGKIQPDVYENDIKYGGANGQKGAKENEDEYYDKGSWGGKFEKDISKPDYYPEVGEDGLIKTHEDYEREFEEIQIENKRKKKEQQVILKKYESLEDEYFQKFMLQRKNPKAPFTYKEIMGDLNGFTWNAVKSDVDYSAFKDIIFAYISDKKWIQQIFDETDGQLKLQLTDEAFTS